jgi:hypothetical protein
MYIAGEYTKAGQKEKALQVLSKALQTAGTIEDPSDKADALRYIAGEYAKAGQELSEKDKAQLLDIVQGIRPIGSLFQKDR